MSSDGNAPSVRAAILTEIGVQGLRYSSDDGSLPRVRHRAPDRVGDGSRLRRNGESCIPIVPYVVPPPKRLLGIGGTRLLTQWRTKP